MACVMVANVITNRNGKTNYEIGRNGLRQIKWMTKDEKLKSLFGKVCN